MGVLKRGLRRAKASAAAAHPQQAAAFPGSRRPQPCQCSSRPHPLSRARRKIGQHKSKGCHKQPRKMIDDRQLLKNHACRVCGAAQLGFS